MTRFPRHLLGACLAIALLVGSAASAVPPPADLPEAPAASSPKVSLAGAGETPHRAAPPNFHRVDYTL